MCVSLMGHKVWKFSPEGLSAFACPQCGQNLTIAQEKSMLTIHHRFTCLKCGKNGIGDELETQITPAAVQFMDADSVRETTWFHSTSRRTWIDDLAKSSADSPGRMHKFHPGLDNTMMVHLGTADAAMDRATDGTYNAGVPIYVYEVRLHDGVHIEEHVKVDMEDDFPKHAYRCEGMGFSPEVTRYVNSYESPGSISLVVKYTCFEVVNVTVL